MLINSPAQMKWTTSTKHVNLTRKEIDNPVSITRIKFVYVKTQILQRKSGGFTGEFY